MGLLKLVLDDAVDPDYAAAAAHGGRSSRHRILLTIALVAVGALLAIAALQNFRTAPVRATERQELINRVDDAAERQDAARATLSTLQSEVGRLRETRLGHSEADQQLEQTLRQREILAGVQAMEGPGLIITVDDAPGSGTEGRVIDTDLQQLINGLWQAGAEAIAINDHRLTSRSAIRGAGDAITVNYRSLTRPYRIEAIGDPDTLESRYIESAGGVWWTQLQREYGLQHDVAIAAELKLPADPGLALRHARKEQG